MLTSLQESVGPHDSLRPIRILSRMCPMISHDESTGKKALLNYIGPMSAKYLRTSGSMSETKYAISSCSSNICIFRLL